MLATILYNMLMAVALAALLWKIAREESVLWCFAGAVMLACFGMVSAGVVGMQLEGHSFSSMRLLSAAIFIHGAVYAAAAAWFIRRRSKPWSVVAAGVALATVAVGIDAFYIEPHWLAVTHCEIRSSRVDRRLRIAILADIQTDDVGDYERQVFAAVKEQQPDVILFAGDYLQVEGWEVWQAQRDALKAALKDADLSAPLGMFAVGGNVDWHEWPDIFTDSGVRTITATKSFELSEGKIQLTCLSMLDSFDARKRIPRGPNDAFHICLGHAPDYALGEADADLLVAGHTHGGQVQLPIVGPLVTLSKVARSWASGMTEIGSNKYLIVSRGIGMERAGAPQLRFLCRPEVAIVDVIPE